MILSCQNIDKTFDGEHILDHVSFHLEEHDRAALIGVNGAGKSTILRIIVGELAPDEGDVSITKGKTIGYLAQYQDMEEDCTIYEEVRKSRQYLFDMEKEIHETEELMQTAEGDERVRGNETRLAQQLFPFVGIDAGIVLTRSWNPSK